MDHQKLFLVGGAILFIYFIYTFIFKIYIKKKYKNLENFWLFIIIDYILSSLPLIVILGYSIFYDYYVRLFMEELMNFLPEAEPLIKSSPEISMVIGLLMSHIAIAHHILTISLALLLLYIPLQFIKKTIVIDFFKNLLLYYKKFKTFYKK